MQAQVPGGIYNNDSWAVKSAWANVTWAVLADIARYQVAQQVPHFVRTALKNISAWAAANLRLNASVTECSLSERGLSFSVFGAL